jgi:flotillin
MKGEAEAFAIEAKAKAEAEQMEKKAAAWKEYQDAAIVDMILDVLPKVLNSIQFSRDHYLSRAFQLAPRCLKL